MSKKKIKFEDYSKYGKFITIENTKTSKELMALQDLSKFVFIYGGITQYRIIEKALLEKEKQDKAIRIIIKKQVNIADFLLTDNLKDFNKTVFWVKNELTKKEYDLLKEVIK